MSYPRLAARLYNAPLLITLQKAEVIERVFRGYVDGSSVPRNVDAEAPSGWVRPDTELVALGGATRAQGGYLRSSDGVALIQVVGSLVQRAGGGMDALSGLESYDSIGSKLNAAMGDPMVRGILLEIDSHGGEGGGLFDLSAQIRAMDKTKPITAHANEQAFSAAYALAASAPDLIVAETGMVGSVGVIMLHVDQSTYDAKRGLVYTPIFAGARKADFSPHAPLSDAAQATAQAMVDRLYSTFVSHVANMRGIDQQTVRETEAGLLHPDQATSLGMVDSTGTLSTAVASLRERMKDRQSNTSYHLSSSPSGAAGAHERITAMATNAPAAPATPTTEQQIADARTAGLTEGKAEATKEVAAATALAAKTERERVAGIMGHAEAQGRTKLAQHLAFKTDSTIEAAAAVLAASSKEAADNPLAAAMAGVKNPAIGADAEDPVKAAAAAAAAAAPIDTAKVYEMRREAVKAKATRR